MQFRKALHKVSARKVPETKEVLVHVSHVPPFHDASPWQGLQAGAKVNCTLHLLESGQRAPGHQGGTLPSLPWLCELPGQSCRAGRRKNRLGVGRNWIQLRKDDRGSSEIEQVT